VPIADRELNVEVVQGDVIARGSFDTAKNKNGEEDFCAYVVVCNLNDHPQEYTLRVNKALPDVVVDNMANHAWRQRYNVTIHDDEDEGHTIVDIIVGYGSSVLRLGCLD